MTAAYNYDIRAFMKKWLSDLRNDQTSDGEIVRIAPYVPNIYDKNYAALPRFVAIRLS